MTDDELKEFATLIVQSVRDSAIQSCNVQIHTDSMRSPITKRWRDAGLGKDTEKLVEMVISDCVDNTIFHFLQEVENGSLELFFESKNRRINLSKEGEGELSGFYIGEWRSSYTKEQCFNDLL